MAAVALGVTPRQLANALTRIQLAGATGGRQGLRRRLDLAMVAQLDLVAQLGEIGVPATLAFALAGSLERNGELGVGAGLALKYARDGHLADLERRLEDAVERVVPRRRGRPRRASARARSSGTAGPTLES